MSRKVTNNAISAFESGRNFGGGNTTVKCNNESKELFLHGNLIAKEDKKTGILKITNAGWQSNTTKERLNGLPNVSICQKKGQWFLNGNLWDGKWIEVK